MKKEEYRAILSRLPIKTPTLQDMEALCPHLTTDEVAEAFTQDYVALPPLRVKHGFQIVSHRAEWVEEVKVWRGDTRVVTGTKNHPARLDYSYANRTLKSYADGKKHGDVFCDYFGMEQAMKFAEDNWSDELILDSWISYVQTYIQDPTDLVNDKYHQDSPRTKVVLTFTLNRDLNVIINDHSKPESELFDEAVVEMTVDHMVAHELKGGRGGFTHFQCAHCGHGLSLSGCGGCGHRFRDDHFRMGMDTPLSRKMVAFLRDSGHKFEVDPEIAWQKERERWGRYAHRRMA